MKRFLVAACILPVVLVAQEKPKSFWTLGIYTGPSPFKLSEPADLKNPVLRGSDVTDMNVDTLAHPFMLVENSHYYLFFTAKFLATDKGGIGLAESTDGKHWKYRHAVIQEPYVISHPFVFKWRNEYYIIPETHTQTSIRLYRATQFPDKWVFEKEILTGAHFVNPSIVRFKNMWWMFVTPEGNETLRLFYAQDFKGPWTEHPLSPIIKKDLHSARPAGRPLVIGNTLYRLAQDCAPTYGNQVWAFQITDISPKSYAEKKVETPIVKMTGQGWNGEGMHHVDAQQIGRDNWIAIVDALGR